MWPIYQPILDQVGAPVLFALILLLLCLEYRNPLRRWVQSFSRRLLINTAVSVPSFAVMRLVLIPAEVVAAYWATKHRFGLLYLLAMPRAVRAILAFVLLDYTLFIWHVLSHRVPLLWRLHNVHHTDLDLS